MDSLLDFIVKTVEDGCRSAGGGTVEAALLRHLKIEAALRGQFKGHLANKPAILLLPRRDRPITLEGIEYNDGLYYQETLTLRNPKGDMRAFFVRSPGVSFSMLRLADLRSTSRAGLDGCYSYGSYITGEQTNYGLFLAHLFDTHPPHSDDGLRDAVHRLTLIGDCLWARTTIFGVKTINLSLVLRISY